MATVDNLLKRNVPISNSESRCALCQMQLEDANHIFLSCIMSAGIWNELLRWLGKQSALHSNAIVHSSAFTNIGNKKDGQFLAGVWMCTVWCIWKGRNEVRFNHGKWAQDKMVAEIKSRLWSWKQAYNLRIPTEDFRAWFAAANLEESGAERN
ncbi:uncharacterized protein LOC130990996 [Salvia miltiorrhiza]|uniref:uncharacterized protein LOC130990996 n=1 Tax=Salvia miltiorrhiza TaxID=226208 RepID=UPI0025AC023E|nr:uncharacterized protein LOC130990996 [Salvia miltiorrhiza]